MNNERAHVNLLFTYLCSWVGEKSEIVIKIKDRC